MAFDDAVAYARFMGRFSDPLAVALVDALDLTPVQRALDVGCGGGALTAVLAARLGPESVAACDPSEPFVRAVTDRLPGVSARVASAEALPFDDDGFDLVAASLVVHFMTDPIGGLREMARVARPGGVVAATVWDRDRGPLSLVGRLAAEVVPAAGSWPNRPGTTEGHLIELLSAAGLRDVTGGGLGVHRDFATFEDWWTPYTLPVGPLGEHLAALDPASLDRVRERCRRETGEGPFGFEALAWVATGRA